MLEDAERVLRLRGETEAVRAGGIHAHDFAGGNFTEMMLAETGLIAMVGKAERGPVAIESIKNHKSAYLMAVGGAAYLVAKAIRKSRVLAFEDLGMGDVTTDAVVPADAVAVMSEFLVGSVQEAAHRFGMTEVFVGVILVAIKTSRPLEFSSFPAVLLLTTTLRLALNVASTRVVLVEGHKGTDAAGKVIQAFGEFVIHGNYLVGSRLENAHRQQGISRVPASLGSGECGGRSGE